MDERHVDEETLQAYLDGELAPLARLRARWHLARCAACRSALSEHRALRARAASLLSGRARPIDVEAGWRRVTATHAIPHGTGRDAPLRSRSARRLQWSFAIGATMVIAAAIVQVGTRARHTLDRAHAGGEQVRDVCCFDLDGGGPGDDGILTLSRSGQQVDCVVVYDDIDRTRTFSAGDRARYASNANGCGRAIATRVASSHAFVLAISDRPFASAAPHGAPLAFRGEP